MKNNLLALSVCFLAVSVLVSGGIIAKELSEKEATPQSVIEVPKEPSQLINQEELAAYLGISVKDSILLGPAPAWNGVTESQIPFIQIGGLNYYSRIAVDEWLRSYGGIISVAE
ncbi:hypothetical protein MKY37_00080 [Psychrobacillus sp. FSL K6-2836]|uniref:hypothetical protein n=1 Tax=Psychrobacillus sp. FSL K6-2836 TaxID=2921548 RepID=UPI0030F56923